MKTDKTKTLVQLPVDSMPHTDKKPKQFKPKGKKAELVGRLAKRNYSNTMGSKSKGKFDPRIA